MRIRFNMYISSLLLASCLTLGVSGCSELSVDPFDDVSIYDYEVTEQFTFHLSALGISKLQLEGINGNVIIGGTSQTDSVIIICEKKVMSESREDAQQHLSDVSVNVQSLNDTISVKTIQPNEASLRSYAVDYLVSLPVHFETDIELTNGTVQIDSIENKIDVTNINGNVTLNEITGNTFVNTINGNIISKQSVPLNGGINHLAINGNIHLSIPEDSSAEISALVANGSIQITNLNLHNIAITPISYNGILGSGEGNIFLETANGTIKIDGY